MLRKISTVIIRGNPRFLFFMIAGIYIVVSGSNRVLGENQINTSVKEYQTCITWAAVAGAGGYSVELRSSGNVRIVKETDRPEINLRLPLGKYQMRITVIDKFRVKGKSTPWTDVEVVKHEAPVIAEKNPIVDTKNDNPIKTAEPVQPAKDIEPDKQVASATPTEPIKKTEPVQPAEPATPIVPEQKKETPIRPNEYALDAGAQFIFLWVRSKA
jgi:hypothetical protein